MFLDLGQVSCSVINCLPAGPISSAGGVMSLQGPDAENRKAMLGLLPCRLHRQQ